MFHFQNIEYLWLLVAIVPFLFIIKNKNKNLDVVFSSEVLEKIKLNDNKLSKKRRTIFLLLAYIFLVIAFARPIIKNAEIKIKSSFVNMVVGIDISKSMFATDVYPNRFIFTKQKFDQMLGYLKNTKVSLIGFNANTYLISPLTEDFESLKYLSQNLNVQSLNLGGTDILNTLETANMLFENQKNKVLFLLTDGGDNAQYSKEIAYAKKHNISVYIYNIGTTQGGIVKIKDETLKDKNGNLVVLKLNENIKELALKSGGAYMKQTLYDDDIKLLVEDFLYKFKAKNGKNSTIKDNNELFYIPLLLCVLFFMISIFSLPALSRKDKSQKGIK